MSDVDEMIRELDLDEALAHTYEVHGAMVHRAATRRRAALGGGLVAAAVAVAVLVPTLGGGSPQRVGIPAPAAGGGASTSVAPTTTERPGGIPDGYVLSTVGDVHVLQRIDPSVPTTTTDAGGAVVGIGDAAGLQRGELISAALTDEGRSATLTYGCVMGTQHIDTVRYRVESDRVVVDGAIGFDPGSAPCGPSSAGTSITVPLPATVPAGTPIVAEPIHTP
jgi:hypothetical protein